jgi:hypothetical protein
LVALVMILSRLVVLGRWSFPGKFAWLASEAKKAR